MKTNDEAKAVSIENIVHKSFPSNDCVKRDDGNLLLSSEKRELMGKDVFSFQSSF